jgi:very-short-patch-repair endonuclease
MDRTRARARRLRSNPTDAEMKLWQFLRRRQLAGFRFRRQVPLAGFIADFACLEKNLIVELDGGQHVARARYDAHRTEALEALGYRVLRYWNDVVLKQMPEVLEDILRALEER